MNNIFLDENEEQNNDSLMIDDTPVENDKSVSANATGSSADFDDLFGDFDTSNASNALTEEKTSPTDSDDIFGDGTETSESKKSAKKSKKASSGNSNVFDDMSDDSSNDVGREYVGSNARGSLKAKSIVTIALSIALALLCILSSIIPRSIANNLIYYFQDGRKNLDYMDYNIKNTKEKFSRDFISYEDAWYYFNSSVTIVENAEKTSGNYTYSGDSSNGLDKLHCKSRGFINNGDSPEHTTYDNTELVYVKRNQKIKYTLNIENPLDESIFKDPEFDDPMFDKIKESINSSSYKISIDVKKVENLYGGNRQLDSRDKAISYRARISGNHVIKTENQYAPYEVYDTTNMTMIAESQEVSATVMFKNDRDYLIVFKQTIPSLLLTITANGSTSSDEPMNLGKINLGEIKSINIPKGSSRIFFNAPRSGDYIFLLETDNMSIDWSINKKNDDSNVNSGYHNARKEYLKVTISSSGEYELVLKNNNSSSVAVTFCIDVDDVLQIDGSVIKNNVNSSFLNFYSFTPSSSGYYDFEHLMSSNPSFSSNILISSDLSDFSDGTASVGNGNRVVKNLSAGTKYYILCSVTNSNVIAGTTMTVRSVGSLGLGEIKSINIPKGSSRIFFNAPRSGDYVFLLETDYMNIDWSINARNDGSNVNSGYSNARKEYLKVTISSSGEYELVLKNNNSSSVAVTFCIDVADELQIGSSVTKNNVNPSFLNFYSFTPSSSGYYDFEHLMSSNPSFSSNILISSDLSDFSDGTASVGNGNLAVKHLSAYTKYYILCSVTDSDVIAGTTMTVSRVGSLSSSESTKSYYGTRQTYNYTPSQSGNYTLTINNMLSYHNLQISIFIMSSNGSVTLDSEKTSSGGSITMSTSMTSGTGYFVVVKGLSSGNFNYGIKIAKNSSNVNEILVGETKTVDITTSGQKVRFTFNAKTSGTVTFESSNDSTSIDPTATLYTSSNTELKYDDDGAGNRNFKITHDVIAGNTYYIDCNLYYSLNVGSYTLHCTKI